MSARHTLPATAHDSAGRWTSAQQIFTRWADDLVIELQDELARTAAQLTRDGHPTPCTGSNDWHAPDRATRAQAARACLDACELLDLCRRYADLAREPSGVWGGIDREDTP